MRVALVHTAFFIAGGAEGLMNFHLETDVPRRRIHELMSEASIYLHPPLAEHFGIAIAEAAAAGLVPAVYGDGGRVDGHSLEDRQGPRLHKR
ncbi:MAG: glycosyltransferase [Acidilobus sp.]